MHAEALLAESTAEMMKGGDGEYCVKMEKGLKKYAGERRWRSVRRISTAYVVGWIQECDGKVMRLLKKRFLSRFSVGTVVRIAEFDCGKLV